MLAVVGLGLTVTVVLIIAIGSGGIDNPIQQDKVEPWRTSVGVVLTAAALPLMGWGLIRMARSGAFRTAHQKQLGALTRRERREASRWVRSGANAPAGFQQQTAAVALAFQRQGTAMPLYAGLAVSTIGLLLRAASTWMLVLLAVACLGVVLGFAQLLRDSRRGARWLAAHPAPDTQRTS